MHVSADEQSITLDSLNLLKIGGAQVVQLAALLENPVIAVELLESFRRKNWNCPLKSRLQEFFCFWFHVLLLVLMTGKSASRNATD